MEMALKYVLILWSMCLIIMMPHTRIIRVVLHMDTLRMNAPSPYHVYNNPCKNLVIM